MNQYELLLLFNTFWLYFTMSLVICIYYDLKYSPQEIISQKSTKII